MHWRKATISAHQCADTDMFEMLAEHTASSPEGCHAASCWGVELCFTSFLLIHFVCTPSLQKIGKLKFYIPGNFYVDPCPVKLVGRMELHGKPSISWTRLVETAEAGSSLLKIEEAVDWEVGTELVITPTERGQTEEARLEFLELSRMDTSIKSRKSIAVASFSWKIMVISLFGQLSIFCSSNRNVGLVNNHKRPIFAGKAPMLAS